MFYKHSFISNVKLMMGMGRSIFVNFTVRNFKKWGTGTLVSKLIVRLEGIVVPIRSLKFTVFPLGVRNYAEYW